MSRVESLTVHSCRSQARLLVLKTTDIGILDTLVHALDHLEGFCPSWSPESTLTPGEGGTETQLDPESDTCLLSRCTDLLFAGLSMQEYQSELE